MNKKALYEKIMRNVSKEVRRALNENEQVENIESFPPFKVNLLLCLDDEDNRERLYADLETFSNADIQIKPNPYGEHYSESLVVFTISNTAQLKEWAVFFLEELYVDHVLAEDRYDEDALELQIDNDAGRKKFHSMYRKYFDPKPGPEERLAKRCAEKLCNRVLGGDYNDLRYFMVDRKDKDRAREILRGINRNYRKRVFTKEEMDFIIDHWNKIYPDEPMDRIYDKYN